MAGVKRIPGVRDITSYGRLHLYAPVSYDAISSMIGDSTIDTTVRYAHAEEYREAVSIYTKIAQDTVLYVPSDIPRTKALRNTNRSSQRERVSREFLSNCIYYVEDSKGRHPRVLFGQRGDYSVLKAKAKHNLASELYIWLVKHPSVINVMVADASIMLDLIARVDRPQGKTMKELMFRPFIAEISNVKRTVMLIPSPSQLDKNEEKGYHLTSEIFDMIQDVKEPVEVKGEVLRNIDDLQSAIRRIDSYFNTISKRPGQKTSDDLSMNPVAIDLETSGLNPHYADQHILTCQFSAGTKDLTFSFIVDHPNSSNNNPELGYAMLTEIIGKSEWTYVFQNGKFDMRWMQKFTGKTPSGKLMDTMLLDHYLNETYGALGNALKVGLMAMDSQIPRYLHYPSHKSNLLYALADAEYRNDNPMTPAKHMNNEDDVGKLIDLVMADMIEIRSGQYMDIPISLLLSYGMDDAYYHVGYV